MDTSSTTSTVLSHAEADTLRRAQENLRALSQRSTDRVIRERPDDLTCMALGRLAEAADMAKDAAFNVLSTASSYLDCENASKAIARMHGRG